MARMTAALAAVEILRREGVTHMFGLPGAAINPFYAAMRAQGELTHVLARHVEGASHMSISAAGSAFPITWTAQRRRCPGVPLGHVRGALHVACEHVGELTLCSHGRVERIDRRARQAEHVGHALTSQNLHRCTSGCHPCHWKVSFGQSSLRESRRSQSKLWSVVLLGLYSRPTQPS